MSETAFEVIANAVRSAQASGIATRSEDAATYRCGAVFIKHIPLPRKGNCVVQHSHNYDHVTLIASGSVMMTVDGKESYHEAPSFIKVEAGKHHAFVAVDNNTNAYCIHDLTGTEFEKDDDLGVPWEG